MIKLSTIKKEQPQPKTIFVDLNVDLGEGFGIFSNNKEEELLSYVSSVNIPCGGHAGDPGKIMDAIKKAKERNLSIGAHIGYPDIAGFGYREMNLSFEELQAMILYQVGALKSVARAYNMNVDFVRPHGALYKQMARDEALAISVAKSLEQLDHWLILVGPVGKSLNNVQNETKIRVAPEILLEKQYSSKGEILFDEPEINDTDRLINIAGKLIREGKILTKDDTYIEIDFKTIHLSTTSDNAVRLAQEVRNLFPEKPLPVAVNLVGENVLY